MGSILKIYIMRKSVGLELSSPTYTEMRANLIKMFVNGSYFKSPDYYMILKRVKT